MTEELTGIQEFRKAHRTMRQEAKPYFDKALDYDAATRFAQVTLDGITQQIESGEGDINHLREVGNQSALDMLEYADKREEALQKANGLA